MGLCFNGNTQNLAKKPKGAGDESLTVGWYENVDVQLLGSAEAIEPAQYFLYEILS